jgi:hypothetical protein
MHYAVFQGCLGQSVLSLAAQMDQGPPSSGPLVAFHRLDKHEVVFDQISHKDVIQEDRVSESSINDNIRTALIYR